MWCDIKSTKYGDRLSKQIGDRNAKEFAMGIEQPKFKDWFGNGKTVKLENGTIVPFINPIMQIINEKGKAFNILKRFKFQDINDVRNFFSTNHTPGIRRWGTGEDTFFISKDDNRLLNVRLLEEIDDIYPGLIIKTDMDNLYNTTKDYQSSSIESNVAKPTWYFTIDKNYVFTQNKLFSKQDDLIGEAVGLSQNIKGFYKEIFNQNAAEALFEVAVQANSTESEYENAEKIFGKRIVEIARQLYPDVQARDKFSNYEKDKAVTEFNEVDTKLKTLMDKLSNRFNLPYEIVNRPSADWKGYYDAGKDVVVVNQAKITGDIPFHEFLHPFILVLEKENKSLYDTLVSELETTQDGINAMREVGRKYPELSEDSAIQEALVTYLGRLSEIKYNEPKSTFQRFINWLKSLFKKIQIDIPNLSLTTKLSDIADLMADDLYVADMKGAGRNATSLVKYAKSPDTELTYQNLFDRIKDRVTILNATVRRRKQGDQFRDDIEALNNILENADEITSINNFISNALTYVDSAYNRFESLRDSVKKAGTLSKDDISYNLYILGEIQQLLNVYETLDDLKSLYVREGAKSTDDNMASLREAIDKKDLMVEDFKSFALTYLTEWLYPYIEPTNTILKEQGYKDDLLTKDEFRNQLKIATSDISAAGMWLGTTINSKDPISAAIGLALKDIVYQDHLESIKLKNDLTSEYNKLRSTSLYSSKANEREFNMEFLKEVDSWEQINVDEEGNPEYGYVSRLAFHEEFNEDQFDKARRNFYKEIGPRPSRSNRQAWVKWQKAVAKWYSENTQVNPRVETLLREKKNSMTKRQYEKWILENTKEMDEEIYDSGYKKSDFFKGKIHSVNVKRGVFRIYTGELIKPSNKYKNSEFSKMMSNPYYKELYNNYTKSNDKLGAYGLRYGIIPQVSKGKNLFSNLKWTKGVKGNLEQIGKNAKNSLSSDYDPSRTVQRQDGTEVKKIPINFTTMLENEDLVVDLLENVLKFSQMANNYESMTEIEPNILVLKTVLNGDFNLGIEGRKIAKTNTKGKAVINAITKKIVPKLAQEGMVNKRLNEFINDIVYGDTEFQESINILGYDLSLNKLGDKLGLLTALQNMAFNMTGGINNVIIGNFNNSIEAFGGRFWGKRDWAFAHKEYFLNIPQMVGEIGGMTHSVINDMGEHYDVPQGEFIDQFGRSVTGGQVNKLLRTSSLFFIQKGGEHEIQMTGMMSLMHATKIKSKIGEDTNLYNAWKEAGSFEQLKKDYQWTEEQDVAFRNKLHAITKTLQGVYNKFDKSMLQRRWLGKLAIMFRKYMFSSFKARYGSRYIDYELGTAQEGYWNTFVKKLYKDTKDYKWGVLQRMWTKEGYSEIEKSAVNKTLYEVAVILGAMILAGMVNEDDDKSWIEAQTALQLTRMSADITQYISPSDFIRVVRNPAASVNMIEKWMGWFAQLTSPTEVYDRASGIAKKGDNKLYIKTLKLVPVIRQFVNFMTPEEQLKFYQLSGSK